MLKTDQETCYDLTANNNYLAEYIDTHSSLGRVTNFNKTVQEVILILSIKSNECCVKLPSTTWPAAMKLSNSLLRPFHSFSTTDVQTSLTHTHSAYVYNPRFNGSNQLGD